MRNWLLVLVLLIGCVSASTVNCVIIEDRVLVEVVLSDGDEVVFPKDASLIERSGDKVSFVSKEFVKRDGEWIFVLPEIVNGAYDLEVVLPSGFVLTDSLVYPKGYELGSDGKSIILEWEGVTGEEVVVFYEGRGDFDYWYWVGIFCLIVGGFLLWKTREVKFKGELERLNLEAASKKKVLVSDDLTRNLFGEEKRIVEFLASKKSCWMKDLVRGLGISKVMVTRKVRSLVEKGIIEKEKFGRESKISLSVAGSR